MRYDFKYKMDGEVRMKQERYLAQMIDKDGHLKDFYRFSCKSVRTVRKNIEKMANAENMGLMSLYRSDWIRENVDKCCIFEVRDGVYSTSPVMEFRLVF